MYKIKKHSSADMPDPVMAIRVLVLNATLKHERERVSNTGELADLVVANMREIDYKVDAETIRLADKNIPVGLEFKESDNDDWPYIADRMRSADIVIFATPIWWGGGPV